MAIGLAIGLYFLPFVTYKFWFIPVILIASVLPDIDSASSSIGRKSIFRPAQAFLTHRGPLHSYTVCVALSSVFAFFLPIFALPFFLGYSFHLFADSFTINGIKPFWPWRFESSGIVRTGGMMDRTLFVTFIIVNLFLLIMLFVKS